MVLDDNVAAIRHFLVHEQRHTLTMFYSVDLINCDLLISRNSRYADINAEQDQ